MMRIGISCLCKSHLVRLLTVADAPQIYSLCQTNPYYYRVCEMQCTKEQIERDLTVTPPGKMVEDKYYLGFFEGESLVGIMDLIAGYPDQNTAFLGFFMITRSRQNCGLGSSLIEEVCAALKSLGFSSVRLGINQNNVPAKHFWLKNGFRILRKIAWDEAPILLAERIL